MKMTVIKTVKDNRYFKLPEYIDTVILGDSYLMTGLIPDLRTGTLNGSKRAEILPFTCRKIEFICENNPQIENVMISLSYLSLTKEREETMRERKSIQYYCDSYFSLYDKKLMRTTYVPAVEYFISWSKYVLGIPFEISKELGNYLRILFNKSKYYHYPFWGGFMELIQESEDPKLEERIDTHFDRTSGEAKMSNILIDYFRSINKYCSRKEIRLIAINTPKMKGYDALVPEVYKKELRKLVAEMRNKNRNFYYFDYTAMEMSPEYIVDADHLNYKGAEIFSNKVYNRLNILLEGVNYDD